jgi:pyruvate/2-oxoglutarate dehydrogenase complex dihydrolipoamide acyltransferase (E2) component
MSTDVLMPKLGFSMSEGQIAQWLISDGEPVTAGQPLFTLESDKSVTEIEAPDTGILRILVPPQQLCEVGTLLGRIE